MKASREIAIEAIEKVVLEIIDRSVRVDGYKIKPYGKDFVKLTIFDPYGNVVDCIKGTPYYVLCVAKSWLYPLLR